MIIYLNYNIPKLVSRISVEKIFQLLVDSSGFKLFLSSRLVNIIASISIPDIPIQAI